MNDRRTLWRAMHEERRQLVHDLEGLSEEQWRTPSLCAGWSVHDVVAHLVDAARTTRLGFVGQLVGARFDFDLANEEGIRRHRAAQPGQTLEGLRAVIDHTDTPPAPLATRLVEAFVHGEDVRRPLGTRGSYATEHVMEALRYQARTRVGFGGGKERVSGLRLRPADADASLGDGPEVRGSAVALLLAVSGRPVAGEELQGEWAGVLASRR